MFIKNTESKMPTIYNKKIANLIFLRNQLDHIAGILGQHAHRSRDVGKGILQTGVEGHLLLCHREDDVGLKREQNYYEFTN